MTLSLWPDEERKEKLPEHKAAAQRILDVVEKEIEGLEKRFKGEKCRLKIVSPFTFIKIRLREILNDGSPWSAARIGLAEWVKQTQSEAWKQHLRAQKSDFMKEYFGVPYKEEEGEPRSLAEERVFKKSVQLEPTEAVFVEYALAADKMRRFENAAMAGKEASKKILFGVLKDLPTVRSNIQEERTPVKLNELTIHKTEEAQESEWVGCEVFFHIKGQHPKFGTVLRSGCNRYGKIHYVKQCPYALELDYTVAEDWIEKATPELYEKYYCECPLKTHDKVKITHFSDPPGFHLIFEKQLKERVGQTGFIIRKEGFYVGYIVEFDDGFRYNFPFTSLQKIG